MNRFSEKSVGKLTVIKSSFTNSKRSYRFFILALVALFVSLPVFNHAKAAAGDLDLTFGSGGKASVALPDCRAYAAALQPDGKIVLGGASRGSEGEPDTTLVRLNYDGSPDFSFGSGGIVKQAYSISWDIIHAVALQPDGKIVTAGEASSDVMVARFNANGSRDLSFAGSGRVRINGHLSIARAVALQNDGKIVVAGQGRVASGTGYDFLVARLNTDGRLDTSFGTNGIVLTDFGKTDQAYAMVIQPDGRILVGGEAEATSNSYFALARYNTDGSPDNSFGINGKVTTGFFSYSGIHSIALTADNKIVAAGSTSTVGSSDCALARYNLDGSLDQTFDFDGLVTTDFSGNSDAIRDIAIQADGHIIATGQSSQTSSDFALFRYNANGSLDTSFGQNGRILTDFSGSNDQAYAVMLQPLGEIVVAGYSLITTNYIYSNFAVARYKGDGLFDFRLQDDTTGNTLKFNSVTGQYQFTKCGGVTVGGTGTVKQKGCTITLEHNLGDRRISAKVDACQNKGSASIQLFSPNTVFSISDKNIRSTYTICQ